jgi:hypothetical protein
MNKDISATFLIAAFSISTANAALVGRLALTEGGTDYQAYYDTEADLTWLADANAGAGSAYDNLDPDSGRMSRNEANTWAADLSVGGIDGWRLANTIDVGNDGATYTNVYEGVDYGYNITTHSELSNMFYNVLGNTAYRDTSGNIQTIFGLINTGPFSNLQSTNYWSATEYVTDTNDAWFFSMVTGFQSSGTKDYEYLAWAVHSGDVSAVPIPPSVFLFSSGLIGLIGFSRKQLR